MQNKRIVTERKLPRLGVMLVGLGGNNGSTFTAGVLANKLGLSWENIMSGVLSDGRIEKLHTDVPGHDGKFGFGGACFPKDTSALSKIFEKVGIKPYVLDATIKQNKIIRDGN